MRTMLLVWQEQKDDIATPEEMRAFDEKLRREWAVETGLIERIYALDRGVTEMLIERGVEEALIPHRAGQPLPEKIAAIINDHKNVVDGLFEFVADRRQITTSYIKELHAALVQNQHTATGVDKDGNKREVLLIKGDYKKHSNNPTRPDGRLHEYCPPEHVNSEMDNLIKMHGEHIAKGIAPEVSAAWLHHRFTQIHPFQDGNGRVARCLATIIFLRARGFPLTIRDINGERAKYIDALEAADRGNMQPLVSIFAESQRREFARAMSISRGIVSQNTAVSHQDRTKHIIESAARKIAARQDAKKKKEEQEKKWVNAEHIADKLRLLSTDMLNQARTTIIENIAPENGEGFVVENTDQDLFRAMIMNFSGFGYHFVRIAHGIGYTINESESEGKWARLTLNPPDRKNTSIVVSFHKVGSEYRGTIVCLACFFSLEPAAPQPLLLTDMEFLINYKDTEESATNRFRPWLEQAIERGLALWHESL